MKIILPSTNRVHVARQKELLNELAKSHEVKVVHLSTPATDMSSIAGAYAVEFDKHLKKEKPDIVLIRGDRFEMLPLAMVSVYNGIKIVHIEAGDLSGVIDNKVRHAITQLADMHFATNQESYIRLIQMGCKPEKTFNFGSLDIEYALKIASQSLKTEPEQEFKLPARDFILCLYHEVPGEDLEVVLKAVQDFTDYEIIGIKGNKDYSKNPTGEEFTPEQFIHLLGRASCLVGNSSAGIKEAGIFGVPVVNIGNRQMNRLRTHNIKDCQCEEKDIKYFIQYQLEHGRYEPDLTYYRKDTSNRIAEVISGLPSSSQ